VRIDFRLQKGFSSLGGAYDIYAMVIILRGKVNGDLGRCISTCFEMRWRLPRSVRKQGQS
jgi:hypothetical protein